MREEQEQMKVASLKSQKPALEEIPAPAKDMVFIKGGCFQMGDIFGVGDSDERPVHKVCVDDFYLGEHEVTQGDWKEVMGNNPTNSGFKNCGDDCPVERLPFHEIQEFISNLNRKTGGDYRLPTEAEWEYAAREGGKPIKWAGTNREHEVGDYAWYGRNSNKKLHPVKSKKPNSLGLYDMSGNVWEQVQDSYSRRYYESSTQNNPKGPYPDGKRRVIRGGSFFKKDIRVLRVQERNWVKSKGRGFYNGFRLAKDK